MTLKLYLFQNKNFQLYSNVNLITFGHLLVKKNNGMGLILSIIQFKK